MDTTDDLLLVAALFTLIAGDMGGFSLLLPYRANRRVNMGAAVLVIAVDLVGLPTYTAACARLLIVVGLVCNGLVIGYAWTWRQQPTVSV